MNRKHLMVTAALAANVLGCEGAQPEPTGLASSSKALTNGIELIAIGTVGGHELDLSEETSSALENGAPGNLLGGVGSGFAYAGRNRFLAVPDRGPNASAYNTLIDDTTSYISRFHEFYFELEPSAPGAPLPFSVSPFLKATTLLHSKDALTYGTGNAYGVGDGAPLINDKDHFYFSGRSDNYAAGSSSTDASNARFDPESIRVSNDGERVYMSDEYGPYVYEFDRETGRRLRVFSLPSTFAASNLSSKGDNEISGNTVGRVANKGMEGLAISPDGKTLFGVMQSPLIQDGGTSGRFTRIVAIDIASGATRQYAYELTNIGTSSKPKYGAVSEILAVSDHEFLLDERDGKGLGDNSAAAFKRIYHVDLSGAADVSAMAGGSNLAGVAAPKALFLDIVVELNAHGIASIDIPAKLEGMAFGRDVRMDGVLKHTLVVTNDNDFLGTVTDANHPAGADNPNKFFVFAFDESLLPGYVEQELDNY